ncbi:Deoxyribodipyrimidine photo-lyase [Halomicronema hongdechloris C2206]|uniref:Deoxyribodipyrimidine photo-lyase n=1 Tax=Halomicronema hongdechloris C2206 TaxID=1641165 RepID=A0A1Z3HLP3_9CYAN|nr:FAD-binding domain-containing protein [Halomicronema hongdechloris]ASC71218.1 Deoxyribodipyrimidine photo-lyase [Halomicronema hongdechloris C2206]
MAEQLLFWHRRDLRLADNLGLAAAYQRSPKVVGVFCLDPAILQRDDVAPARVHYMLGCLQELQHRYGEAGGQLLILQGRPQQQIPALAAALGAAAVYWHRDVEPYSRQRDQAVAEALKEKGIEMCTTFWDQLLQSPGQVLTGGGTPYTVYTPFWRKWVQLPKAEPVPAPESFEGLSDREQTALEQGGTVALPSLQDLGFEWSSPLPLAAGEWAAQRRLEEFCREDRAIAQYGEARNLPCEDGTSRLSAALKFGAIGIRTVWAMAEAAYSRCRSDETRQNIRAWQQELAWREFYQHVMYFFPELAEGPYRPQWQYFPWVNDKQQFQAWCQGRTGYPIVDAAMRQLNQTGWMHNRCRMIVASFLTKDLIIDWRWGEKYFMQRLVDGDLAANNGGWQWSASSGMDPKPLRIFNPASQAKKFDPEAEYIRQWLPELRHLDTAPLVTGQIPEEDCDRNGYPRPIVDHKRQQAIFKDKYKAEKAATT